MKKITFFGSIIILFTALSCQKQDDLYLVGNSIGPQLNSIISFVSISKTQLEADSSTQTKIIVKINPENDTTKRDITFTTSAGTFSNGTNSQIIKADSYGLASVYLLSNKVAPANIRVSLLNFKVDTTINFMPALPNDILVSADKYVTDPSQTITVNTALYRNLGIVTEPLKVLFKVTSLDTSLNLVYSDFAYSKSKVAGISLSNPFNIKGRFIVTSKTLSATNDTLTKTIQILIR